MTTDGQGYFESLYARSADPYGVRDRWYEQRKRSIVLSSLPRRRFRQCYEPGCGNGELTAQLAERCDAVLAADFSEHALHAAANRLNALPHVRLARHTLPGDWPTGLRFDLVVLSELLYFLPLADIRTVAQCCAASLADDGVIVACDWLLPFAERATPVDEVHAALASTGLPCLATHAEADFRLHVWTRDARSVAQREGVR